MFCFLGANHFQTESISLFYIYFIIQMEPISDFLCIFAQKLEKDKNIDNSISKYRYETNKDCRFHQ